MGAPANPIIGGRLRHVSRAPTGANDPPQEASYVHVLCQPQWGLGAPHAPRSLAPVKGSGHTTCLVRHTMVCQGVHRVRELSSLNDETCMTVPTTDTMLVVRPNRLRCGTSAALWAHAWMMPTTFGGNIRPQHVGDDAAGLLG